MATPPHIVFLPFMTKGHTIPLLHLAHLLLHRQLATVTFLATSLNASFVRSSLANTTANVISLPFPTDLHPALKDVESSVILTSKLFFLPLAKATKLLREDVDKVLVSLEPSPSALISDMFMGWSLECAKLVGIPRLVFSGMGMFAVVVSALVSMTRPHVGVESDTEIFHVPGFPRVKLMKADFDKAILEPDNDSEHAVFIAEQRKSFVSSQGMIVNSYHELESDYADHWKDHVNPNFWMIGPLCLSGLNNPGHWPIDSEISKWLDERLGGDRPVLYVAFGTQEEISIEQLQEIAKGLEESSMDFIWVITPALFKEALESNFQERVSERGLVVQEWVNQKAILNHEATKGFMSHCGWNSVMESVTSGVPIAAWPLGSDQRVNAVLVEDLGVALRVKGSHGERCEFVKKENVSEIARELLVGERGEAAREKMRMLRETSKKAMQEGGSSWKSLEMVIEEVCIRH